MLKLWCFQRTSWWCPSCGVEFGRIQHILRMKMGMKQLCALLIPVGVFGSQRIPELYQMKLCLCSPLIKLEANYHNLTPSLLGISKQPRDVWNCSNQAALTSIKNHHKHLIVSISTQIKGLLLWNSCVFPLLIWSGGLNRNTIVELVNVLLKLPTQ